MDQKAAQINKAVRARRGDKSGARLGLCRWYFGLCAGRGARRDQRPAAEQDTVEVHASTSFGDITIHRSVATGERRVAS